MISGMLHLKLKPSHQTNEENVSRGKFLSLEEAREQDKLDQFCKEHPSEGKKETFDRLLDRMAKPKKPAKGREA